jgi:hypothetical protein
VRLWRRSASRAARVVPRKDLVSKAGAHAVAFLLAQERRCRLGLLDLVRLSEPSAQLLEVPLESPGVGILPLRAGVPDDAAHLGNADGRAQHSLGEERLLDPHEGHAVDFFRALSGRASSSQAADTRPGIRRTRRRPLSVPRFD